MTDPIILAIAAAIAGKGAESLGAQAGPALARLVRRIKERFAGHPEETAALAAAETHAGASQPDASQPDASQPDASHLDASHSDASHPGGSHPGGSRPDASQPGEAERTATLAAALTRSAAEDPAFAEELRALWQQVQQTQSATGDAIVNNFNGPADKVVQLRDVHGGFHVS